jgi:hypothetical protein
MLTYLNTSSCSIIPGCDVELLLRIENLQPFYNRPWKRGRTRSFA